MNLLIDRVNARFTELSDFLDKISKFYEHDLSRNVDAMNYLTTDRGLSESTIKLFRLGLVQDYTRLFTFVERNHLAESNLVDSGLITLEDNQVQYRMANRIVFPAADMFGRVLGFTGRTWPGYTGGAKYKNTPTTEIYRKSLVLYGLDYAYTTIQKRNFAILVEGQLDVVTLHQYGLQNVVAGGGSALTIEHVLLLRCLTDRVVGLYDADAAGRTASTRAYEICYNLGLDYTDIALPAGEDPDSFARQYGVQAILDTIGEVWSQKKNK